MDACFEVHASDAAGRIGELTVPRNETTVETPALLPVVNPNFDTLAPATLASAFDAQIIITNAYIIHEDDTLRQQAREEGLHDLLGFPGPIMTDSGAFQLAEYGDIDVDTEEILAFQDAIGADIGTPVDIPTPPDVEREQAEADLATTRERLATASRLDTGDMLVTAPIQGSTVPALRERAGAHAADTGLDVFPIGAMVPLLRDYRFADIVDLVVAAKRGLGPAGPVHLFGAGHPMMFALAAAMGCDLFDSAAYALYAREDRYLTVEGTRQLEDLEYLPCACPVCTRHTPTTLRELDADAREEALARHNLHVSYAELRRVKQAIRTGRLLELVESRARAHPAMLSGYRTLLAHVEFLEAHDPVSKAPLFYTSTESADRPEVYRHHQRLKRLNVGDTVLLTQGDPHEGYETCWSLRPPFGPVPPELAETYPLNAELPDRIDRRAREQAIEGVCHLADANPEAAITVAHDGWAASVLDRLPADVDTHDLQADR